MCDPAPRAHPAALSLVAMEDSKSEESAGSNFERGTDTNARPLASTLAFLAKDPLEGERPVRTPHREGAHIPLDEKAQVKSVPWTGGWGLR